MVAVTLADQPLYPTRKVYDTADSTQGVDADHSQIMRAPVAVSVGPTGGATSISVQAKVHPDAGWAEVQNIAQGTTESTLVWFDARYNFVQLVRSGTEAQQAWAQFSEDVPGLAM